MCFSAQASFIASGGLLAIGVMTVKGLKSRSLLPIAMIPFMFGIQQFSEGMIWLGHGGSEDTMWYRAAIWTFLVFAHCIWPTWIPISTWAGEISEGRSKLLRGLILWGSAVAGFNLYWGLTHDVRVEIVNHSVQYSVDGSYALGVTMKYLYAVPIFLPFFISSIPRLWGMGVGVVLGFFVADWVYTETFASVWCFYAAVVSLYLYWAIRCKRNVAL